MLEEKKLSLWIKDQLALKDQKSCEKAIKNGGIAAMITASLTFVLNVIGFFVAYKKNDMEYELDPWLFFDVPLFVIMGVFVFRKSRIAATLLFLYYTISKAIIWYDLGRLQGGVVIVFLAVYFNAMRANYIWSASYKTRSYEDKAKYLLLSSCVKTALKNVLLALNSPVKNILYARSILLIALVCGPAYFCILYAIGIHGAAYDGEGGAGIVLLLVCMTGYILFFSVLLSSRVDEAPLFSLSGILISLYIFGFFGQFKLTAFVLLYSGIISLFAAFFLARKNLAELGKSFFSPGPVFFLLFILVAYWRYKNFIYTSWDEYSHWGYIVKEMVYCNGILGPESNPPFKYYPPGTGLFQSFISIILGYSEGVTIFAQDVLMLAALSTMLQGVTWKNWITILSVVLFSFSIMHVYGIGFSTVLIDHPLGVCFAAGSILFLRSKKKDFKAALLTLPVLFILPLIKSVGFLLALIACASILVVYIVNNQGLLKASSTSKKFFIPSLLAVLLFFTPILSNTSWNSYIKTQKFYHNSPLQFTLKDVVKSFSVNATTRDIKTITAFKTALFNKPLTANGFSTVQTTLLVLFLAGILLLLQNSNTVRHVIFSTHIVLLGGFLIYVFGLLLLYLYSFTEYEGVRLASFERYIGVYFLGWFFVLFSGFYPHTERHPSSFKKDNKSGAVWKKSLGVLCSGFLAIIFLLAIPPEKRIAAFAAAPNLSPLRQRIKDIVLKAEKVCPAESKVYILWQHSDGLAFCIIKYELSPRRTNGGDWSVGTPFGPEDVWTAQGLSPQKFSKLLAENYDFLILGKATPSFWNEYGMLFDDLEKSKNTALFQVVKGSASFRLRPIVDPTQNPVAQK